MLNQLQSFAAWFVSNSLRRIALLVVLLMLVFAAVAPNVIALADGIGGGSSPTPANCTTTVCP